ncbi:TonB-dependent receptor [Dyadobacter sp. LJ53]|uniref:SusC/RagA family TonB-linked outer membrane protein n=1 Tax=Dyadobacter chenwenxiniae TaxID=2906456 RepID=UPI001F1FC38C|nr:TonB-dependent receptor [Dyadobacter chenwenxiniae]MCF0050498.1 TonB-dependent receptor [Dyadobacter chenwenxiniae]
MLKVLLKSVPDSRKWVFLSAFILISLQVLAQNVTVKGTVTSAADKTGLPGVNIVVKNTVTGTTTDAEGKYELSTPSDAILVFSGIGYVTQELAVNGRTGIDLQLAADTKQLDELVVVGYGTQKRNSLTNSVSTIKGEDVARRPVSNIQQSFQGLMPGVAVTDLGGSPGKSNATIRVRGITTFNINGSSTSGYDLGKNDALVIVDGIEQQLSDISPDDIESVSILKDAASTAIYGSRATNGVVLITTKRAKGSKVQVDYHGYYALQKSNNVPQMMGLEAYMREQVAAYTNAGSAVPARFTEESIQAYVNATDREKYPLPNTWFETLLRTAPQHNHSLSIAGGTEALRTRLSVRYQDQEGVIKNFGNKIGEFRLNTDYDVSKRIRVSADINYRTTSTENPTTNTDASKGEVISPLNNFFHGSLWAVPKYPDGTYGLSTQGNNPLMFIEIGGQSKQKTDYLAGYIKGEFEIAEGLVFSTQIAGRGLYTQQKNYTNSYVNTDKNTNITKTIANNSLYEIRNTLREYTINNLLTYEKGFGSHNLKALAGYSQIGNTQTFLSAYRERFYNNGIGSIGQGANDGTKTNTGRDAEYGLRSFFGRVNYDYDGKYLLEVNGRYDGSSKFTGDKQYSFFPSFSAGWRISKEKFWQGLQSTVNDLKFRGSWGITGNQSVDLYSYYAALTANGYSFGGLPVQGYRQNTLANTNLGWESTTQLDIGLDAAFFQNRLNLTVDYYNKETDDILLNLDIPATIGLTAPPQNAGSVQNKGWEFSLNYHGTPTAHGFRYNVGGNLSINENLVTDLKGTGPYLTGSDIDPRYIIKKGLPINTLWGYKTDGLFQTQQEITEYKATYASNTKPGDVKYVDLNGDGKIDANDMTAIGNSFPKYTFGLNADFSYKNFDLNILFQGAAKVDSRLAGALAEMGNQEGFTHEIYTDNYWTPERTDARFPRPVKFDLRNVATSDRLVLNGSYLRLKNVQLAYNVPSVVSQKIRLSRIRVYVSATNVFTISELNEWNLDPEAPSGRAVYFPQTALYTAGLNLQF